MNCATTSALAPAATSNVPALRRRLLFLRRSVTVLAILEAA